MIRKTFLVLLGVLMFVGLARAQLTNTFVNMGPWSYSVGPGNIYLYANNETAVANFYMGNVTPPVFTTGHDNLFIGLNTGDACTTCIGNLGIGHSALGSMVSGINNTAVGWDSQFASVAGNNNTSLGEDALKSILTGGDANTGIAYNAGPAITTGDENTLVGVNSGLLITTGSYNVGVGHSSLSSTAVAASYNTAVGHAAGRYNGGTTTAIGYAAGGNSTNTGTGNVYLGHAAGYYESGNNSLFIDNAVRASESDARLKALVYGIFASTTGAQSFRVNGGLQSIAGAGTTLYKQSGVIGTVTSTQVTSTANTNYVCVSLGTLVANTLNAAGDYIDIIADFERSAAAATVSLTVNIGGTCAADATGFTGGTNIVSTTVLATVSIAYDMHAYVIRGSGATVNRTRSWFVRSGNTTSGDNTSSQTSINLAADQTMGLAFKTSASGATDVKMNYAHVRYYPAP